MSRLDRIRMLVAEEMAGLPVLEHDPALGLPLQVPSFGADEAMAAIEALLATEVTMGRRVRAFEEAWAAWCGTRHAVMVNSGSSANLLAWSAMRETGALQEGDEVVVPAVGWSTTIFPILQAGLRAVVVDVDPATLCIDVDAARSAISPTTRACCAVHLLGCPAEIQRLLAQTGLPVVEDACAAHGAERGGRKVGSIGLAGTFSFFFSHHVTTIEGGMLVTDDDALANAARSLRAHGWIREMTGREALAARYPDTDPRFLFVTRGYNLRPTELAGAFGPPQLARLPAFVARRRANHAAWCAAVAASGLPLRVFPEPAGTVHSGFAFPLLIEEGAGWERDALLRHLESRRIATRPISGGNLLRQPALQGVAGIRKPRPLPVADAVHDRGFFVGNSHAFGPGHGHLLLRALEDFPHA
jgi:CDP-4-dehydro-6-deoxyglucose reductase, E1